MPLSWSDGQSPNWVIRGTSAESALKKALALVTAPPPRKSAPSAKPKSSRHQSTVVSLPLASLKPR